MPRGLRPCWLCSWAAGEDKPGCTRSPQARAGGTGHLQGAVAGVTVLPSVLLWVLRVRDQ